MDEYEYNDYDYHPEYYHGITGICIRWTKTLKRETVKREHRASPTTMKLQNQELMQPKIWEFKMEDL